MPNPSQRPQSPLETPPAETVSLFSELLYEEMNKAVSKTPPSGMCLSVAGGGRLCHLCWGSRYDYAAETAAKSRALKRWSAQNPSLPVPQWVPSPQGRHYRCVSKRRWLAREDRFIMTEEVISGKFQGLAVTNCYVEPPGHAKIYKELQMLMPRSRFSAQLNYAIIKGDLEKHHLLLNLTDIHQQRAWVNKLSKKLTQNHPNLLSVWVVQGKADDDYYLNPPPGGWERLYGPKFIKAPNGLHYSPLCFTQINSTLVPKLVETVGQWLPDLEMPMLDLYCGYGLFSLSLGRTGPIVGLELSHEAVNFARDNAAHRKIRAHFAQCDLEQTELAMYTRRLPARPFVAVLDPPRGGASLELVAQLAELGPDRVVHLVCDVEKTFEQASLWQEQGYRVERMVALDMFPGTSCLEIALCLSRGANFARLD